MSTYSAGRGRYAAVSIGATAAIIKSATQGRRSITIHNAHATQILYLGTDSSVTTSTGLPLAAGAKHTFTDYMGDVYGIASGAGTDTRYLETY